MNVAIHIYPYAGEVWSPIASVDVVDHLILPVGRSPSTATSGTVIYGRLKAISPIDRGVSLLENRGLDSTEFKGVGGIAKTGDFTVTLIDTDESLDMFAFLGRTIKICLLEDSASNLNYSDDDCLFVGYIKNVEPSANFELILTVADPVVKTLSQTIGTEIDTDKIIPINYGDFTTSPAAKMAAVYKDGKVYVDSKRLEAVTDLQIYDSGLKEFYSLDGDINANSNNNEIDLIETTDLLVSVFELFADTRYVILYNPYTRSYLPNMDASSVAVGDEYSYTVSTTTVRLYCVQIKDGYLIFDDPYGHSDTLPEPPASGTLTKVSGSGPATITYSFRSAKIDPVLYYEADVYDTGTVSKESMTSKAMRCLFKIDDEVVQIARQGIHFLNSYNGYMYSAFYIIRGVENTTPSAHSAFTACQLYKDSESSVANNEILEDLFSKKYVFGHTFKVTGASGFTCLSEDLTNDDVTLLPTSATEMIATHGDLNKIGGSSPVEVNISTDSAINGGAIYDLYFETKLPKPTIAADIVDMFFYGKVEFDLSEQTTLLYDGDYSHLFLLMSKGGLKIPITSLSNDNYIGVFKNEPALLLADDEGFYLSSNYPCLAGSRLNTSSQWAGSPLRSPSGFYFLINPVARESIDREEFTPGTVVRQWFDNTVSGRNPLKCFSLASNPGVTLDGRVGNLSDLDTTKYFLIVKSLNYFKNTEDPYVALNQSVFLSNIGLHVLFAVDLNDQEVYISGKGRVTEPSHQPIPYPNVILQHLLLSEYPFSSVAAYEYSRTLPGLKTTLSVNGPRVNLFDTLEDFCKKHCLILTYNRLGEIIIQSCLSEMQGHTDFELTIDDSDIIPDSWSQSYTSVDRLMKSLTIKYAQRKSDEVYTAEIVSAAYTNKFNASNEPVLKHPFIHESKSAEWLVEKMLDFYKRPIRELKTKVQLGYYQIGAWVTIDSDYLPKTKNNKYLLTNTVDCLPVDSEPYTELTLLELINPSQTDVLPFNSTITETGEGVINETSSDSIITES